MTQPLQAILHLHMEGTVERVLYSVVPTLMHDSRRARIYRCKINTHDASPISICEPQSHATLSVFLLESQLADFRFKQVSPGYLGGDRN